VIGYVPRSLVVAQSELYGQTVIEAVPKSEQAQVYRNLATYIDTNEDTVIPKPLNGPELKKWAREWGDRIFEVEAGVVHEMASI
jgi:nitrogenase iron protein NifH